MARLGIDIGGTKTHAVVLGEDDAILAEASRPTGRGPAAVVDSAVSAAREASSGIAVASVGVGVPGAVDRRTGTVRHAVNLDIEELSLAELLQARLGHPVAVENDVHAAAVGAFHADPVDSMAYLNLGTGMAAGLVLDGRLWRGADGVAGEIGHLPLDPDGLPCECGQRGCLETVATGSALARRWPQGGDRGAHGLFDDADAGDPAALLVRDDLVTGVAAAVRLLVLTTGVSRVVVGGGISSVGERLRTRVVSTLLGWSEGSPFLASVGLPARVRLLDDPGAVGAVGAALVGSWRS